MRLLVVEDSHLLRDSIVSGLRDLGHAVDAAGDGEEALRLARTTKYDAIVLDWMLPKRDGIQVLAALADRPARPGVLMLTARDAVPDRVEGLRHGADDYLVKPFAFEELVARIHAVARRARGNATGSIKVGPLTIDLESRTAIVARGVTVRDLALTAREFAVLEALALRKGRPVSRLQLEEAVYDSRSRVFSNAIDSAIAAIRGKLESAGCPPLIQTRRGIGYLIAELQ